MKMMLFSVFDKGVNAFMQPFFMRAKGEAVRSFMDACSDGKTNFCRHPEDYTLFFLGVWDDTNAEFVPSDVPEKVISALECVSRDVEKGA